MNKLSHNSFSNFTHLFLTLSGQSRADRCVLYTARFSYRVEKQIRSIENSFVLY